MGVDWALASENSRLRRIPWSVHTASAIWWFGLAFGAPIRMYGVERSGSWSVGAPMRWPWLVLPLTLVAPLVAVEVCAVAAGGLYRWVAGIAVLVTTGVLAGFGAVRFGFRIEGDVAPVRQDDLETGVSSSVVLATAYLALVVVGQLVANRVTRTLGSLAAVAAGSGGR